MSSGDPCAMSVHRRKQEYHYYLPDENHWKSILDENWRRENFRERQTTQINNYTTQPIFQSLNILFVKYPTFRN